jgi:tetratricopeptide (TPR) repeat protein
MAYLRSAPDAVVYEAARIVATLTLDFSAAHRIARLLAASGRSAEMHGFQHILAAILELAAGRWDAARRELSEAAPLLPARALEYQGLVATLPFLPVEPGELEELRRTIAVWDAGAVPRSAHRHPAFDIHHEAYPALRLYLLGALSARLGDAVAATDHAADLDRLVDGPDVEPLARDLAQSVRARVAAHRGDLAAALAWLERARGEAPCMQVVLQSPFYTQTAERWLRAELLQRLGRHQEALRWYRSIVQSSLYDLVYLAPSHLRRAEIHERLGEQEQAAGHYRRLLELWGGCDPALRPAVDEAAVRLDRLAPGRSRAGDRRTSGAEASPGA